MGYENIPVNTMSNNVNLEKLGELLELENNNDLVRTIIENITNKTVTIDDIGNVKNGYEVFMSPSSGFTNKELEQLNQFFDIVEIGVYGDPYIPDETVYFHMIVEFN